jgi:hypothetical protein
MKIKKNDTWSPILINKKSPEDKIKAINKNNYEMN